MTENAVDQVARDNANRSISLIEGHEKLCAELWGHNKEALEGLRRGVEGLYDRLATIQTAQASMSSRLGGIGQTLMAFFTAAAACAALVASIVSVMHSFSH